MDYGGLFIDLQAKKLLGPISIFFSLPCIGCVGPPVLGPFLLLLVCISCVFSFEMIFYPKPRKRLKKESSLPAPFKLSSN